jgi:hypothetical protein
VDADEVGFKSLDAFAELHLASLDLIFALQRLRFESLHVRLAAAEFLSESTMVRDFVIVRGSFEGEALAALVDFAGESGDFGASRAVLLDQTPADAQEFVFASAEVFLGSIETQSFVGNDHALLFDAQFFVSKSASAKVEFVERAGFVGFALLDPATLPIDVLPLRLEAGSLLLKLRSFPFDTGKFVVDGASSAFDVAFHLEVGALDVADLSWDLLDDPGCRRRARQAG